MAENLLSWPVVNGCLTCPECGALATEGSWPGPAYHVRCTKCWCRRTTRVEAEGTETALAASGAEGAEPSDQDIARIDRVERVTTPSGPSPKRYFVRLAITSWGLPTWQTYEVQAETEQDAFGAARAKAYAAGQYTTSTGRAHIVDETLHNIQVVEVTDDPIDKAFDVTYDPIDESFDRLRLRSEYHDLPEPFASTLQRIIENPGAVNCMNCHKPVGYVPSAKWPHVPDAQWLMVALLVTAAAPDVSRTVTLLCENCTVLPDALPTDGFTAAHRLRRRATT